MVSTKLITADDLYRLGPDAFCELIEGELIEVNPPGGLHGEVAGKLAVFIGSFVLSNKLGKVFTNDTGFVLEENPDTVLGPDLAFVRHGRLLESPRGYIPIAPDLAIEVVSPSNTKVAVARKTGIYLRAGVEQVWIVDPVRYEITVHECDSPVRVYGLGDVVSGGAVLPGFELRIGDLFE